MERSHRKLFPGETPTNQTLDCYGFCDPACPSNCYTNPDYYFPPPPPHEHSTHISSYLIILISLFTVIFIVVGFYVIKIKCYADWCGWRVNGSAPSQTENAEEFLNENQVDHPVWLIATVGLQQSIINSITVCRYRKGEGLIEGTECSVCLNEFHDGETLRLLPKCSHAFHIPCIDTWLRSHTNCPLCRAGIVSNSNNNNNNVTPDSAMSNLGSVEQENANLGTSQNQESLIENSTNEGGLSLSLSLNNNMVNNGAFEDRASTGESSEALELSDESNSKEGVVIDPTQDHGVLNDEMQIEMGSMSTDPKLGEANSCSTEPGSHHHHHVVDHIGDDTELHKINLLKQDGDYSKALKTKRRSSIEECLHISPVIMKRSFSWNGRILSTRGHMNLNSTLPY